MRHLLLALVLTFLLASSARADEPSVVNVVSSPALIAGAVAGDRLQDAQLAGDVNGDGNEDLIVVQDRGYDWLGNYKRPMAYVVFGRGDDAHVDLATLGERGFEIPFPDGWRPNILAAGDVNGDGRDDLVMTDSGETVLGRRAAGRVIVVFGKSDTAPVNLDAIGNGGFELRGSVRDARAAAFGYAEDVNGDGRDDLLVEEASPDRILVVFGKSDIAPVDLATLASTSGGYVIGGAERFWRPASVGDVNGDGRGDIAVANYCDLPTPAECPDQQLSVVFGKPTTTAVNVRQIGTGGFQLRYQGDPAAHQIGDVNGDGLDDIGIYGTYPGDGEWLFGTRIVFGRATPATLDLDALGDAGYLVRDGIGPIAGVGDVDGDGRDDFSVSVLGTGADAVFFGKSDSATVEATQLLGRGFSLGAPGAYERLGTSTFGAGPRIAVNYDRDDPFGRREAGSVRFAAPPRPSFALPAARAYVAGSAIQPIAVSGVRRSSSLAFRISPPLPPGLQLDPVTGTISGTPTQARPTTTYTVTGADRLGSGSATIALRVDPDAFGTTAPANGAVVGERPAFAWERASAPDDSEPVSSYTVVVDDVAIGTLAAGACTAAGCSLEAPSALADGPHRWHVETTARDGRVRRTPTATLTVVAGPTARLSLSADSVLTDAPIQLDASASTDVNGAIASYAFDLDGDGSFESVSASPQRTATFATVGDRRLGVRVTDAGGSTSEAFANVRVAPAPPRGGEPGGPGGPSGPGPGVPGVSINDGAIATNDPQVTLSVVWPAFADSALISNDGGFGAVGGTRALALRARIPWRLSVAGSERLPRIVYVRFRGGAAGHETYTDDIILDQRAPQIVAARLAAPAPTAGRGRASGAARRRQRKASLHVTGRDDNSGIRRIEVAARRGGRAIATKQLVRGNLRGRVTAKAAVKLAARTRVAWVRITDVAGNRSAWKVVRARR